MAFWLALRVASALRLFDSVRNEGLRLGGKARGKMMRGSPFELRGFLGIGLAVRREAAVPVSFRCGAPDRSVPSVTDLTWNIERRIRPIEREPGSRDLIRAQRRSMAVVTSGLGRRAPADCRFAADQRRTGCLRLRRANRLVDGLDIMPVHIGDDLPAIGLEALGRVVGKPTADMAIDGNAVVIVKHDQPAQAERSG